MREEEWLLCPEPESIVAHLPTQPALSERKRRLFAVVCWKHLLELSDAERADRTAEVAERYADGLADERAVMAALKATPDASGPASLHDFLCRQTSWCWRGLYRERQIPRLWSDAGGFALCALVYGTLGEYVHDNEADGSPCPEWFAVWEQERARQCSLLLDIIQNQFGPVTVHPSWLTPKVTALATTIYDQRAFHRLPILADALDKAGCDNADILDHCRGESIHARRWKTPATLHLHRYRADHVGRLRPLSALSL
jgi:hypothetical protein